MTQSSIGMAAETSAANSDSRIWLQRTWIFLGLLLVFRLIYMALVPLNLVHDEAYYWDWSRNLDWGYYSKPPVIAWLIAASTSLGGSTEFFVRLPAVLLGTLGVGFIYTLAATLYDRRIGFFSAVVSALTPGNVAMSMIMTIDAPFIFCWCGALFAFWMMVREPPGGRRDITQSIGQRWLWMAVAVVFTGFGLLSKQTMITIFPLAIAFLILSKSDRRRLLDVRLWLWVGLSLAFLTPVIVWNARHDWITLQHTGGHFSEGSIGLIKRITNSAEFVLCQFGVCSPIAMWVFVLTGIVVMTHFRKLHRREVFLVCFSVLPLLGIWVLSFKQRLEPNWPAPFYAAGMILTVGWMLHRFQFAGWPVARPFFFKRVVWAGAILVTFTYSLPFTIPALGLSGSAVDPFIRLRGWSELGSQLEGQLATMASASNPKIVVTTGRRDVSELAFYAKRQPEIVLWNQSQVVQSQYDIWGPGDDLMERDLLVVTADQGAPPEQLVGPDRASRKLGELSVDLGRGRTIKLLTYHVTRNLTRSARRDANGNQTHER